MSHAEALVPSRALTGTEIAPALPATGQAAAEGAIGERHIAQIHKTLRQLPTSVTPEERASTEGTLVELARQAEPAAVAKAGHRLSAHLDPDGPEPTEPPAVPNVLRRQTQRNGRVRGHFDLGAEAAAYLDAGLSVLAKPRPEPDGTRDKRGISEREGDAFAELLALAIGSDNLPVEAGEAVRMTVHVAWPDLAREHTPDDPGHTSDDTQHVAPTGCTRDDTAAPDSATGGATEPESSGPAPTGPRSTGRSRVNGEHDIPAGHLRQLACTAGIVPLLLSTGSVPLDIGRTARTATPTIRRALAARDGGCSFPNCPLPARWCDTHHITEWQHGGVTATANMTLLCGRHHQLLHNSHWDIRIATDGHPEYLPPAVLDPHRRPRRNTLHTRPNSPIG